MKLDPLKILGLAIPSFCIFYTFSWAKLPPLALYEEAFGSHSHYLDLYYDMNPRGPFLKHAAGERVKFSGYLVTDGDQEAIRGERTVRNGRFDYTFETSRGKFVATLGRAAGQCEPRLRYRVVSAGTAVEDGIMKGAFCP